MQVSPSLAELMAGLNDGPRGIQDAFAEIEKCSSEKSILLDLQQMGLTNEDLAELAPKLAGLASHVKELNIFLNEITVLPTFLSSLSSLEILRAGCNPLERIEDELFQGLPDLREMDIGYSEVLSELPDSFHFLTGLKVLHAGNGRLSSIPPSLFECKSLEELHLYGNCLKEMSEKIGCLTKLKVLNLGRNQMKQLPKTIGHCESLEVLHVYENCLRGLPEGVARLENLKSLNYLSNANMPVPPREVRHSGKIRDVSIFLGMENVN